MRLGRLARINDEGGAELVARGDSLFDAPKGKKLSVNFHGVNLEAGVVIEPANRAALGRVCRYILRPTVSLAAVFLRLAGARVPSGGRK